MRKIRCSTLPLFMLCANTTINPDELLRVEKRFDASEVGTLIHRLAEDYILTGTADPAKYKERLTELDGLDRAVELMPNIQRVWDKTKDVFETPIVEEYLEARIAAGLTITGHIDVNEIQGNTAFILDWKTGRVRDDHYHQVAGYAYLLYTKWCLLQNAVPTEDQSTEPFECYATICYAEDGGLYPYHFTENQLSEWAEDVEAQVKNIRYVVNRKCVNCPLSKGCEAFDQHRRTAVAAITHVDVASLRDATPGARAEVIQKLKVVEDAVKDVRAAIKDDVRENGPMETGDGRVFKIITSRTQKLDTGRALEPLEQHVTPKELLKASTISLPQLKTAVYKRAEKGNKQAAVDAMLEDLEEAKAVTSYETERLECRKIPKKLEKKR